MTTDNRYKAWGESRYASGALPTKFTYTGQYSNVADFGLMYYGARWYDSALSRFAQADSIIPQSQGVQAWDRYAAMNNNPVNTVDPTGHWPEWLNNAAKWVANTFFPPTVPGTHFSPNVNVGLGKAFIYHQLDIVTSAEGELQFFHTVPSEDGSPAYEYIEHTNTLPDPHFVDSPQVSITIAGGPIGGEQFAQQGTNAFAGEFIQGGGSLGLPGVSAVIPGLSADSYQSVNPSSGQPTDNVSGFDIGATWGVPFISGNRMAVNSTPITKSYQMDGVQLLGCRIVDMCGR